MPSRISGACTPCRSKKQKCSGHHPTCTQCANATIECTWPEQRKRGPAKGYIEALESRLHSAESLLLAVLPLISDNVLERAANTLGSDDEDGDINGPRRSSPPLLNKKTGQEYWETYPIDNRKNIRIWQFSCESNSAENNNGSNNSQYGGRDNTNTSRRYPSPQHSPASAAGMASPRNSSSGPSQQQSTWLQSMQPYVSHSHSHQMQTGAAQQLLNLSNQQRRNQWMTAQQHPDSMQLDPNLMQPRVMPPQAPHIYAGNVQQSLFW